MPPVAIFSVKKYLPKLDGASFMPGGVYHAFMAHFSGFSGCLALEGLCLFAAVACGTADDINVAVVRVQPEAAPLCGAPEDARTMIVRALGEFPASEATAQSVELGGEGRFLIERFPGQTRMLEAEVRGFGGALRTVGRSEAFDLDDLPEPGGEIAIFMAPLHGVCETGPTQAARVGASLAQAASGVLVVGGEDLAGNPSLAIEIYRPREGRFETLAGATYGDTSALGLAGASVSALPSGDVVLIGGAATAFQRFDGGSEEFLAPAFYREARGYHAAIALSAREVFVAGGCSQLSTTGCQDGSELRTSAILDVETGEITSGPSLQVPRIGGSAWLEKVGQVILVGGTALDGSPVLEAERVFLDGRASDVIPGLSGASAQSATGTLWAGLGQGEVAANSMSALAPGAGVATTGLRAAFADGSATLIALEDGSLLGLGEAGAQRIRTFEGAAEIVDLPTLNTGTGRSAIRLTDGTVLVVGGQLVAGEAAPSFIYRPALVGPYAASATASFSSPELSEGLAASNPEAVEVSNEGHARLSVLGSEADGSLVETLLVAGPRPQAATLQVAASTSEGAGLQLVFAWHSPEDHYAVVIEPGAEVVLTRMVGGLSDNLSCTTSRVVLAEQIEEASGVHEFELRVQGASVRLNLGGVEVVSCSLDTSPAGGAMGVGVLGSVGDSLRIDLISLSR